MPEGHTIHRLAVEHKALLAGAPVAASSPQGRFTEGAAKINGQEIADTDAHGKHLFHRYGGWWLHVHLGLYGQFDAGPMPAEPVRGQVRLRLLGSRGWADLRGPTACELLTGREKDALHARLGPDPLRPDADPDAAWARISRSSTAIGRLLMDQSVLAGVGNVYRAEVLFRQGIEPGLPGRELGREQWIAVWGDLCALMREGVRVGRIDTVRPAHTPEAMGRPPRDDDHGGEVYVYRRAGQQCLICADDVRTAVVATRNLYWCPTCQTR